MARKSVKIQRSNEIADAFEAGVARHGVEGTHLELIAKLSGIQRPALRHFIGNRDKIILFTVNRFLSDAQRARRLINAYHQRNPDQPLSMLLMHLIETPNDRVQAIVGLIGYAKKYDNKKLLQLFEKWHGDYHQWLVGLLKTHYKGSTFEFNVVADGILNIAYSQCVLSLAVPNNEMYPSIELLLAQLTPKKRA